MANTLLDVVQGILQKIDSDAVNSIGDTVESDQIADLCRQVYYDIIDEAELPGLRKLTTLEAVSDLARPNMLRLPNDTQALLSWQYDTRLAATDPMNYTPVDYKLPSDFLKMVNQRNASDTVSYQIVYVAPSVPLIVDKRFGPRYWTSFDDTLITVDSYNASVDATLQASKTQAWLEKRRVFMKEDTYVIDLPENLYSLFYRTAENEAYAVYKQVVNPNLDKKERRLRIRQQRNKHRSQQSENNTMLGGPDYGRR